MWGSRSIALRPLCRGGAVCAAALALAAGCSFVNLDREGAPVELREASQIPGTCQKIGKVNTQVRAVVLRLRRSEEKVRGELATLARNEAGRLGGNAISAIAPPESGRQSFDVYLCSRA